MDCRNVNKEMKHLRSALTGTHARLCKAAPQVPKVCATLLKTINELRKTRSNEPIITVQELISGIKVNIFDVLTNICKYVLVCVLVCLCVYVCIFSVRACVCMCVCWLQRFAFLELSCHFYCFKLLLLLSLVFVWIMLLKSQLLL